MTVVFMYSLLCCTFYAHHSQYTILSHECADVFDAVVYTPHDHFTAHFFASDTIFILRVFLQSKILILQAHRVSVDFMLT